MKSILLKISAFAITLGCFTPSLIAQTSGTMNLSFIELSKSPTYGNQGKHVLVLWIENSSGQFVKTLSKYGGTMQGNTEDHLSAWSVIAGGSFSNCTNANTIGAVTGATLTSFSTRTAVWNGTDVNGSIVPDGSYKIGIEETWNHGTNGTYVRYINFTKGSNSDNQSPADDANFANISLSWSPSTSGLVETKSVASVKIYPNPSTGIIHVDYDKGTDLKVVNVLGVTVAEEKLDGTKGTKNIDLSNYNNGIYFFIVSDGIKKSTYKIVLNK